MGPLDLEGAHAGFGVVGYLLVSGASGPEPLSTLETETSPSQGSRVLIFSASVGNVSLKKFFVCEIIR